MASETKRISKKRRVSLWFIKHILVASILIFVTSFFALNGTEALYSQEIEKLYFQNLTVCFLISILGTISWNILLMFYRRADKMYRIRELPFSYRVGIRKILIVISWFFAFLSLTSVLFLVRALSMGLSGTLQYFAILAFSSEIAILSLLYRDIAIMKSEWATYYIDRFSKALKKAKDQESVASSGDLAKGLRYFEQTLPSPFALRSVKEKLIEVDLVLEKGTKKDRLKLAGLLQTMANAIKANKNSEFDAAYMGLADFLHSYIEGKSQVVLQQTSKRALARASFAKLTDVFMTKVIPTLVILGIAALIYNWLGIRLNL
jgi:hypothetical protein